MSLTKTTKLGYSPDHARSGLDYAFPAIETFPNQFPGYEIEIDDPEFTSVCPKTGLPDFGTIYIKYMPNKLCFEMKSLKLYMNEYRNLGIFQENVTNQILEDVVRATQPIWAEVRGVFMPRGGLGTTVVARYPRPKVDGPKPPAAKKTARAKSPRKAK